MFDVFFIWLKKVPLFICPRTSGSQNLSKILYRICQPKRQHQHRLEEKKCLQTHNPWRFCRFASDHFPSQKASPRPPACVGEPNWRGRFLAKTPLLEVGQGAIYLILQGVCNSCDFWGNLMVYLWRIQCGRNWGIAHEATAAKKKEAHELTEESPVIGLGWWERTIPYPILIYSWSSCLEFQVIFRMVIHTVPHVFGKMMGSHPKIWRVHLYQAKAVGARRTQHGEDPQNLQNIIKHVHSQGWSIDSWDVFFYISRIPVSMMGLVKA